MGGKDKGPKPIDILKQRNKDLLVSLAECKTKYSNCEHELTNLRSEHEDLLHEHKAAIEELQGKLTKATAELEALRGGSSGSM